MLNRRIIPCLDVKDGRTVKGINFIDLVDAGDPVEQGAAYSEQGADELVFLDITATNEKRKTMAVLADKVARQLNIPFTIGGGIGSISDVDALLDAGADKVSINSAAVHNPDLISELALQFGSQCIVAAIDAKWNGVEWQVFISGGRVETNRELMSFALELEERGAGEILFTSMNHDGTKKGFAIDALDRLQNQLSIPVIASGGAGAAEHFLELFQRTNVPAGLAASIFHFHEISIPELKTFLHSKDINIRLDYEAELA